jgi:ABC transporter DrrB family efflux protein
MNDTLTNSPKMPSASANDPVIDVQHLSRRFGELVAVKDVSFQVQRASIFGLLGPNGSGKSTIIRMLLGILPPSDGQATVLGYDCLDDAEAIKPRIGYMSQQFSLYADLTVRENIDFYGRIYGLDPERLTRRRRDVLELTGLTDRVDQLSGTLSGGWQRRLALACALIHEPAILFLDEPTAGIDPVARRQLWDLLFELSGRGVTLFVTTHYMDEAERCTEVGYIFMSKLLVLGKPQDLKELPAVTPKGTKRFELRVPNATSHLARLRKLPGVRDATLFGETVHVLLDKNQPPEYLLEQVGVTADEAEVRQIPPSLEDVFVTLTAQARTATEENLRQPVVKASRTEPSASEPPSVSRSRTKKNPKVAPFNGLWAVLVKEFYHIRRQPITLFFMLVVPVLQTIIFGYAIDIQIENIPMVVFDMDGRREARELIAAFENTRRFQLVKQVHDEESFHRALRSGEAKAGLRIPPRYTDNLLHGEQAPLQVLIDGSDSQVANTALSTAQLLGRNVSMQITQQKADSMHWASARDDAGRAAFPVEVRARMLYNPDLESSHFFVPGLVGIILQLVTLFLTSFAIVRERELGTLEQLFVTPVARMGLLLGKLFPYAIVGFVELLIILTVMIYVFGVQVNGSILLLLALSLLFMICSLSLGLFVSTLSKTQLEAMQFAFVIMLPSVLLSGFVFPRSQMPLPIYLVTFAIPATYFIEILRGIVLRGADIIDLGSSALGLIICGAVIMLLAEFRFRKKLA